MSKGKLWKLSVLLSLLSVGTLAIVLAAVVWTLPSIQDRLMKRMALERLQSGDNSGLLTDNSLHILLCGTGSPMPDPSRANACTAVIAGGHIVIIDVGPGSWSRIAGAKLPATKIDTILLTHLHSDHIGALGEFAVQGWIGGRDVPLEITGPAAPVTADPKAEGHMSGTAELVAGFAKAYDADEGYRISHHGANYLALGGTSLVAHEIPTPARDVLVPVFDKDGLKISAFLVDHHPVEPSYGYKVEYQGRVAIISGDTKKTESVERFSKGADLLVHEALNHDMLKLIGQALTETGGKRFAKMLHDTVGYHTSPVEAAEIAHAANVPLLVLTHIVPPLPNALARHMFMRGVAEVRGNGQTILGDDGLMISMPVGSKEITTSMLR
ncbi:MAG TPA: MBL fold metallo-hydrolase [Parvibaculum sp.]|jgi:ribonuclease Z